MHLYCQHFGTLPQETDERCLECGLQREYVNTFLHALMKSNILNASKLSSLDVAGFFGSEDGLRQCEPPVVSITATGRTLIEKVLQNFDQDKIVYSDTDTAFLIQPYVIPTELDAVQPAFESRKRKRSTSEHQMNKRQRTNPKFTSNKRKLDDVNFTVEKSVRKKQKLDM